MITIEIPSWAFWLLLSLFVLNIVLNHMLWRINRQLREVEKEHRDVMEKLVGHIGGFFGRIIADKEIASHRIR